MSAFSDSVYEKKVGEITGKSTFKIRVDMLYYSVTTGYYLIIPGRKIDRRETKMKHIQTLNTQILQNTVKKGGCGECQTSCQSACKTSCTVGNQTCEQHK